MGDYVDRGQHSLETITLLLALKVSDVLNIFVKRSFPAESSEALLLFVLSQVEYPNNVHLIRGNHEAADINALFGFRIECIERMVFVIQFFIFSKEAEVFIYFLIDHSENRGSGMESGHGIA